MNLNEDDLIEFILAENIENIDEFKNQLINLI